MIDESNLLNFYCTGIYDSTKALTETEIIMKVLEKLNLVILNFNDLECQMMKRMTALEKDVNYYLDTGIKLEVSKKLDEMVELAHKNNMQVAIHAIGDKAMDMVVNSIEKALDKYPRDNHRHGVVHCQLTTSDLLNRFRDLKLHAYIQSIFLDYDINIVEDRIGVDRAKTSYNFNTLFNETTMSNGSDCPVELPNVLNGIYCAVTRKTLNGKGPFLPNQALSVKDAILSFTRNGAYASFEEDIKGDIAVGKAADFVLLSDNLLDIDVDKIKDVKVLNTFLDGSCVYSLI